MKKCLECNAEVDDRAYVCPKCGGKTLMGSYSADDALSVLDSLAGQYKAKEHVDKGAELYRQNRLDEAIAELQSALKIAPMNPTAHGNMGAVLLKQGKPKEAIPWLEKALKLNPNLEGVPQALAQAKTATNKSSGCFVATACYGGQDCWEVRVLRDFRDQYLTTSALGRFSVRMYYAYSPSLASWMEKRPALCSTLRLRFFNPLVARIQQRHR